MLIVHDIFNTIIKNTKQYFEIFTRAHEVNLQSSDALMRSVLAKKWSGRCGLVKSYFFLVFSNLWLISRIISLFLFTLK